MGWGRQKINIIIKKSMWFVKLDYFYEEKNKWARGIGHLREVVLFQKGGQDDFMKRGTSVSKIKEEW